jgi:hypothetical protein
MFGYTILGNLHIYIYIYLFKIFQNGNCYQTAPAEVHCAAAHHLPDLKPWQDVAGRVINTWRMMFFWKSMNHYRTVKTRVHGSNQWLTGGLGWWFRFVRIFPW